MSPDPRGRRGRGGRRGPRRQPRQGAGGGPEEPRNRIPGRAAGPLGPVLPERVHDFDGASNLKILLRRLFLVGKGEGLEEARKGTAQFLRKHTASRPALPSELLRAVKERRQSALSELAGGIQATSIELVTQSRTVVGLSAETPLETGLALDGTYGIPVLPGTALKGATRAAMANEIADPLLGTQELQASAFLLDALPTTPDCLERDVMTPHLGPYYASPSQNAPAEYWQPTPVEFLAVKPGTKFRVYAIGAEGACKELLKRVGEALLEIGIGAKTAAGYGYLKPDSRASR